MDWSEVTAPDAVTGLRVATDRDVAMVPIAGSDRAEAPPPR